MKKSSERKMSVVVFKMFKIRLGYAKFKFRFCYPGFPGTARQP